MRDLILQRLELRPFEPFRIGLTDRSKHDILHPDLTEVTESSLRLYRIDHAMSPPARTWLAIIALNHIVSLEDLVPDEPVVTARRSAQ